MADFLHAPSTYGSTRATAVNSSHLAFSRSHCCHTKANSVNTTDILTANVKRAESLRAVSLPTALILPRRSLRSWASPEDSESSPSLRETTDAVSALSASGCVARNPVAAAATSETPTLPSSWPATIPIRDSRSASVPGSLSLSHTALPAICNAETRSRTVRSPGVEKKLLLRRSYMLPLSPRQSESSLPGSASPSSRTERQQRATCSQTERRPSWQVLACLFLFRSTFSATMNTDPATRARILTGSSSAVTGTDSMNAYPSRNGKCIGVLRSCVVM